MADRAPIDALKELLRAHGIVDFVEDLRGKHAKLRFCLGGRRLMYVCPKTPSDHRTVRNCEHGLRRLIRHGADRWGKGA